MLIIDWLADLKESVFFQNLIFIVPYFGFVFLVITTISFVRRILKMPDKKTMEKMKQINRNLPKD